MLTPTPKCSPSAPASRISASSAGWPIEADREIEALVALPVDFEALSADSTSRSMDRVRVFCFSQQFAERAEAAGLGETLDSFIVCRHHGTIVEHRNLSASRNRHSAMRACSGSASWARMC